jgi:hypothetical protein
VVLEAEPQTLVAPLESIFRDGAEGRPYVFLRGPEGWARREVELGGKNFVSAEVRSGLRAGDVVATSRPRLENTGKKQ